MAQAKGKPLYPMGYERRCFEEIQKDGSDKLTIELHSSKVDRVLILNEEQCRLKVGEGWSALVDFDVPTYRDVPREYQENKASTFLVECP
ncbi:MAG: hypothetical protein ABI947_02610 [Chloroflexota bacterium]